MKRHCSILLVLMLTLAMMVSTCGEAVRDGAQNADAQLQPVCEAYLRCLQENQGAIEQYNWQSAWQAGQMSEPGRSVAVTDVTGDGVPELIYMQAGANTLVTLRIATCRDGEVTWLYSDDSTYWDGQVGGGYSYYLFKIQGDTALYAYLYPTFESEGHIGFSRFTQTADGTLERSPVCEKIIRAAYSESGYEESVEYRVDGNEAAEDGYLAKEEELKAAITEVFQYSLPAAEGEAFSNRFDLQTIGRAMTCGEAISYLQTLMGDSAPQPEDAAAQTERTQVDAAALPASLNMFLRQFTDWYWDAAGTWQDGFAMEYDSEHAADGSSNILASIVNRVTPSCVDFSLYPGVMPEEYWQADPRGWSVNNWYMLYDGPTVDWVAKNIFNITDEEISALLAQGEEQRLFYREDTPDGGYRYYAPIAGGVGDPMSEVRLTSAEFDGQRYFVTYDVCFAAPGAETSAEERPRSYYAELEYKTIDGADYWSLYRNTSDIPVRPVDAPPADELFTQIPASFSVYGNGAWHETVTIGPDGSFTGHYEDVDAGSGGDGYDGTTYYYDIHGTLTEPAQTDEYTYSFKVGSLVFDGTGGEEWIEDRGGFRMRHVFSDSTFVTEGQQLRLYIPGTPVEALPQSYAPNAWMIQGADQSGAALPVYAIYSDVYDVWWFGEQTAAGTLTVTGDQVNIRSGPGTEHEAIGMVSSGTTLTTTGKTDNWYQVDYDGRQGYIIEDYVAVN